jgi:hypothetical protein
MSPRYKVTFEVEPSTASRESGPWSLTTEGGRSIVVSDLASCFGRHLLHVIQGSIEAVPATRTPSSKGKRRTAWERLGGIDEAASTVEPVSVVQNPINNALFANTVCTCPHPNIRVMASTGIEPTGNGGSGSVGVTLRCPDCGWIAVRDVTAALPVEWERTPCRVNGVWHYPRNNYVREALPQEVSIQYPMDDRVAGTSAYDSMTEQEQVEAAEDAMADAIRSNEDEVRSNREDTALAEDLIHLWSDQSIDEAPEARVARGLHTHPAAESPWGPGVITRINTECDLCGITTPPSRVGQPNLCGGCLNARARAQHNEALNIDMQPRRTTSERDAALEEEAHRVWVERGRNLPGVQQPATPEQDVYDQEWAELADAEARQAWDEREGDSYEPARPSLTPDQIGEVRRRSRSVYRGGRGGI